MSMISRMLGKLRIREEPRLEDIEAEERKPMEWLDKMESNKMVKEKQEKTLKIRSAVSPVIATVILVAVTITVAVAVAYWMSSIAGQYTAFEKVEIQSGYATKIEDGAIILAVPAVIGTGTETAPEFPAIPAVTGTGWKVTIQLKNSGSAPSTITNCFVNEKPIEEYLYSTSDRSIVWYYLVGATPTAMPVDGVTLESGTSATIYVYIAKIAAGASTDITFSSGTTVNIKIHSAGGMDYIRLIQLS